MFHLRTKKFEALFFLTMDCVRILFKNISHVETIFSQSFLKQGLSHTRTTLGLQPLQKWIKEEIQVLKAVLKGGSSLAVHETSPFSVLRWLVSKARKSSITFASPLKHCVQIYDTDTLFFQIHTLSLLLLALVMKMAVSWAPSVQLFLRVYVRAMAAALAPPREQGAIWSSAWPTPLRE